MRLSRSSRPRRLSRVLLFVGALAILAAAASLAMASTTRSTRRAASAPPRALGATRAVSGPLIVGLADGASGYGGASTAPRIKQMVSATHTKWMRDTFRWSQIEPTRGHFDFSYYDHYMLAIGQAKLHVVAQLVGTPRWSGPSEYSVPANPTQYADFVAAVLRRYGVHGTFWRGHPGLRGSAITAVELWNEPYYPNGDAGHYDPARYAKLVKATYLAVHKVDPSANLLLEADMATHLYEVWRWWVDSLYLAMPDLNRYFSGVAVHDYGTDVTHLSPIVAGKPYPNFLRLRRIEDVRRQFLRHGAGKKPFWIAETGFSTCTGPADVCTTPAGQRADLQTLRRDLQGPWHNWVQAAFIYRYQDSAQGKSIQGGYGLLNYNGTPKAALGTFRQMAAASAG